MLRIDNLQYKIPTSGSVDEPFESNLFITVPIEFLCHQIAEAFKTTRPWPSLFGDSVYPYPRHDLNINELPSLVIYREGSARRSSSSHFYEGMINIDACLPITLKREIMHQVGETVASAMNLQFSVLGEFLKKIVNSVPGLVQFGHIYEDEKFFKGPSINSNECLVISAKVGFKLDFKAFQSYMEQDNREATIPFCRTLSDLETVFAYINGVNDAGQTKVTVESEMKV